MSEQLESQKRTKFEPRVARAVDYVKDRWFPVNPELLELIQDQIKNDAYDGDFPRFVSDVRGDAALFTYALRGVANMLAEEGESIPSALNTLEIFEWAGKERLEQVLMQAGNGPGRHQIQDADELQTRRFHEMVTSVTTVEELSSTYGIDPEIASSSALLRQLGLALIAWNYPGIYEEAVCTLQKGENLNVKLTKKLGFSPFVLAIKVFEEAGVSREMCLRMGMIDEDFETYMAQTGYTEGVSEIVEVCRVGEALARAAQGDLYPDAAEDWESAKGVIEKRLGEGGVSRIFERVQDVVSSYVTAMPELMEYAVPEEILGYMKTYEEKELKEGNPYLALASPNVARKLHGVYADIKGLHVDQSVLRALVHEVIPEAGFSGGCAYTPDPGAMILVPQLDFGTLELRVARPVDYSIVLSEADMVAIAFQSEDPVVHYKMSPEGKVITAIAGCLGHMRKVGVLYLEIPDTISDFIGDQKIIHFKAIRHAFTDALMLS